MMIKRTAAALMVAVFTLTLVALQSFAQTPAPGQTQDSVTRANAVTQPNAQQKAQLLELAKNWERQAREAEAARDKYMLGLMTVFAELGLKPSETSVVFDDKGEPVFQRAEPLKPAAKPQATPEKKN